MERRGSYRFPFSRYPAIRIALLLITGILLSHYYSLSLLKSAVIFVILLLFFVLAEWRSSVRVSIASSRASALLFMGLIIGFGVMLKSLHDKSEKSATIRLLSLSEWDEIELFGQIKSISYSGSGKERWDVSVDSSKVAGIISRESFKARILADEVSVKATLGDQVSLSGMLIPVSEQRNPEEFNYKQYLRSQGISVQVKAQEIIRLTPNNDFLEWIWWRERALELVDMNFNEETAPIAKALLIGFKQELDSASKQAFARVGLSHIMAVSGLHVGFIVAPFWVIIPYFWTKKYGRELGLLILVLLLFCYAGITGFSASVLRASVMALFLSVGKLYHQLNNSMNFTAAAAIVLLIIDPGSLFEIGFQLSFAAVMIILLILPTLQTALPYWLRTRWFGKPVMVVIISLVVQFGLYPLQVYYFGEISLISPIANALFVPLLGIVVPLSLVSLFMSVLMPAAGFILNYPSLLFLEGMAKFVGMVSTWEWAWTTASLGSDLLFVFWIFLVGSVAAFHISAMRWKMVIGALCSIVLILSIHTWDKLKPATFTATFFDVGQGDAALLTTPSGRHILIDAGVWSPGYNSGKSVITPHLRARGIDKLDAVILSHPHADHIGGIIDLIENIQIDVIYNSGYEYDSNLYKNYLSLAEEMKIPVKAISSGDTLAIDPALLVLVLGPDGEIHGADPNEHSVILEIVYGATEFLFTGDAGIHQEERLLTRFGDLLNTDVLKVGHHGSRTSSGNSFLKQATPEKAIISLAERNKFRHPHREAVNRLGKTKAELLFTSLERAVILESDGERIKRIRW